MGHKDSTLRYTSIGNGGSMSTFWSLGGPSRRPRPPSRGPVSPQQQSPEPRREGPCCLAELPVEVLTVVFRNLGICDLQMASDTCRHLQRAAVDDTSLWAHVELPVNDNRLQQKDKERFLCRLLQSSSPGSSTNSIAALSPAANGPTAAGFVTPTKAAAPSLPLIDDQGGEHDDDEGADFPRGHSRPSSRSSHHYRCPSFYGSPVYSPATPSTPSASSSSSPYGPRAPHVRSLSLLGAREVTGGCLLAFSPALQRPAAASPTTPWACSLRELDLSHCPALQLPLLTQALPSIRRSLTALSLRNTNHLLHDDAMGQILSSLALQTPEELAETNLRPESQHAGATNLRALHLGSSTRRGARPTGAPALTDATLLRLRTACPLLETLSLHNQPGITDAGVVALAAAVGKTLQGLDLGLCSSLSDASVFALASHCGRLRRLSLRNCWRVTNASVRCLLQQNALEALNVYCCTFVSPQAFYLDTPDAELPAAAAAALAGAMVAAGEGEGAGGEEPVLALREANLSYMRDLHDADLLRLARLTGGHLRELSVAKCDSLTNAALVWLCTLCRLEVLNVADCLHVDAGFVHALAAQATKEANDTVPPADAESKPRAAAAAVSAVAPLDDDDEMHPAPLASLHSLNARQCRGWSDATTALLLSKEGCGAQSLRRLYLGLAGAGAGEDGEVSGEGNLDSGSCEEMWTPRTRTTFSSSSSAATATATATAGMDSTLGPSFDPLYHLACGPAAAGAAGASAAVTASLTDRSVLLIARTLGRNLQVLDLESCSTITDTGVLLLFSSCHRLQRLVLNNLPLITDVIPQALLPPPPYAPAGGEMVSPRLPCLVDLHLKFCPQLSAHAVQELKRQRPDILRVFNRRDMVLQGPPAF